jgi:glucose/arabinose dehydrogenase
VFLNEAFTAVRTGTYKDDPSFPKPAGEFTDPVVNTGPAATQYRAADGSARVAADEGKPLGTFTPHRSPLGLQFAGGEQLPAPWRAPGDALTAFVVSWGAAGGTLTDTGNDLLQLQLSKQGDNYGSVTTQVARDFKNPISAVLVEDRLYVLEYGSGAIWELTFEQG